MADDHFRELCERGNVELKLVFEIDAGIDKGRGIFGREAVSVGMRAAIDEARDNHVLCGMHVQNASQVGVGRHGPLAVPLQKSKFFERCEDACDRICRSDVASLRGRWRIRVGPCVRSRHEKRRKAHALKELLFRKRVVRLDGEKIIKELDGERFVALVERGIRAERFEPGGGLLRPAHVVEQKPDGLRVEGAVLDVFREKAGSLSREILLGDDFSAAFFERYGHGR